MVKLKHIIFVVSLSLMVLFSVCAHENQIDKKVQDLLGRMTLEEKVGQLVQVSGEELTGPLRRKINVTEYVKTGNAGSCLNIYGSENVRTDLPEKVKAT